MLDIDGQGEFFKPYTVNILVNNWVVDLSKSGSFIRTFIKTEKDADMRRGFFKYFKPTKAEGVDLQAPQRLKPTEMLKKQLVQHKGNVSRAPTHIANHSL
jgi:hypothetical protein